MRFFTSLIIIVTILGSCKSKNGSLNNSEYAKANHNEASDIVMDIENRTSENDGIALAYRASTRGFFEYVYISEEDIKITQDRNFEQIQTYPNTKADWDSLSKLLSEVDEEAFQNLVAPTDKRHYDAAPHASLTIIHGTKEITTPTFDHGYPPKEIEALVTKILSIKESVSKH